MDDRELYRPSVVFAHRLRELREARGVSQAALADLLTAAGVPMNKWAVMRLEANPPTRDLTLDEALAIALVLKASFAHLLTPPGGVATAITDRVEFDGSAVRDWLRYGTSEATQEEAEEQLVDIELEQRLSVLAVAYADAVRVKDQAGKLDVLLAIDQLVREHDLQRFREVGDSRVSIEAALGTTKPGDKLTRRARRRDKNDGK